MLFGASKLVTEYINRGQGYENIRKVYSINIVYFNLGQDKDIVYHGKTEFRGIHDGDILQLSPFQKQKFDADAPGLCEARERLHLARMTKAELDSYYRHLDNVVILRDNIETAKNEGYIITVKLYRPVEHKASSFNEAGFISQ